MNALIPSQLRDALIFAEGLNKLIESLPDDPQWGEGMHLQLPATIPLTTDYRDDKEPVAWLVANDFNGYDLTTEQPRVE